MCFELLCPTCQGEQAEGRAHRRSCGPVIQHELPVKQGTLTPRKPSRQHSQRPSPSNQRQGGSRCTFPPVLCGPAGRQGLSMSPGDPPACPLVSWMVCLPPHPVASACTASPGHTACPGGGHRGPRGWDRPPSATTLRGREGGRLQPVGDPPGPPAWHPDLGLPARRRENKCVLFTSPGPLVSAAEGTETLQDGLHAESSGPWAQLQAPGRFTESSGEDRLLGGAGGRLSLCGGLEARLQDTARRTPAPAGQSRSGR